MDTFQSERSLMTEPEEVDTFTSIGFTGAEDDGTIQVVEELQNHGIGAADIQKLKLAGVCTIKGVNMTSKRCLLKVKGLSEAKVDKIKEVASKLQDSGFMSALEYSLRRAVVFKLSTGCEEFDRLLGGIFNQRGKITNNGIFSIGGVQSMSITEVFGEFRTGKTQICLTLCISCQLPDANGQAGKAAFIDTEGTLYF